MARPQIIYRVQTTACFKKKDWGDPRFNEVSTGEVSCYMEFEGICRTLHTGLEQTAPKSRMHVVFHTWTSPKKSPETPSSCLLSEPIF